MTPSSILAEATATNSATWEAILVVISVLEFLGNIVMGIIVYTVNAKANKIDELEKRVQHNASEIVDGKLKIHAAQAAGEINLIRQLFEALKEEIVSSARNIHEQDGEKQKLELKVFAQINELKQHVVSKCASKDDVKCIAEQVTQLRIAMGQIFPMARRLPASELEQG